MPKADNTINLAPWPYHDEDELNAVRDVLVSGKTNYWTGTRIKEFEQVYSTICEQPYAIALQNGTLALELALIAFGVGTGDEVITTPRTFLATASAIVKVSAKPVFADVDINSQNITADSIRQQLTPRTKAVICVHLAGWPCEMTNIQNLCKEHNIYLIEDCAQAHGATWNDKPVGSFGDAAAFSFCQDKIISTGGEGGMLLLNDEKAFNTAWSYKDHGKDLALVSKTDHPPGFRWLHSSFGTNWRMTEMQAAIGLVQLTKLDKWVERRGLLAKQFYDLFTEFESFRNPWPEQGAKSAFYRFYTFFNSETNGTNQSRDSVMLALNENGVPCTIGSCPEIYLESAFPQSLRPSKALSTAEDLGRRSLAFLVHPTITDAEMAKLLKVIKETLYDIQIS